MDTNDSVARCHLDTYRAELVELALRRAPEAGSYETAIAPLHFIRCDAPTDPIHGVHQPALCLLLQGRKEVRLWEEQYFYDPLHYLVVSVTLPVSGRVIEASPEEPYLCIRLGIDPAEIAQLVSESGPVGLADESSRGLFLDHIDAPLLDTMLRLVRLLDTPRDIGMLAPLALRELYYRLLHGRQGQRLYEIAVADSQTHRVTRAIDWLNRHYARPLRIEELARLANLSTSTLHHRFKAITAMSPLQYQKQLRLQEARR